VWVDVSRSLGNEPEPSPEELDAYLAPFRETLQLRSFATCPADADGELPTDVDSMRRHGVEPIVLEDVSHFLMIEDPEQFNPVLAATLASFGD
jgi:pimeloyl-ACP methyl ester carboxylesterase